MITSFNDYATLALNTSSTYTVNVAGVNAVTIQIKTSNGAISFSGSIDGINFTPVQAIPLATGTAATSASADGLYQITTNYKFLKLSGTSLVVTSVLIAFNKIN